MGRASRWRCPRGSAGAGQAVRSRRSDRAAEGSWRACVSPSHAGVALRSAWLATPKGSRWLAAPAALRPSSLRLGWAGAAVPITLRAAAPGLPSAPVGPGVAPCPCPCPPPPSVAAPAGAAGGGGGGAAGTVSSPSLASPPRATEKDKGTGHKDPGQ